MNILVVGAAGKTGRIVTQQAVAAGHHVTAILRPGTTAPPAGIAVITGDARDTSTAQAAVQGQDAVIDTVGGKTPYRRTTLETDVATSLVQAMRKNGVPRLMVTSSIGVGDSGAHCSTLVRLVVATYLRGSTRDKDSMEDVIRTSDLQWIITRPAVLTDDAPTGATRVLYAANKEKARPIPRSDLATFLLEHLTTDRYVGRAVTISGS